MLQAGETLDRVTHTHAHTGVQTSKILVCTFSLLVVQRRKIWVGRDNCNCCIKSSDVQLICFSSQERNPLLHDVRIYASVFTWPSLVTWPFCRKDTRDGLSDKEENVAEVPFVFLTCSHLRGRFVVHPFTFGELSCILVFSACQAAHFGTWVVESFTPAMWVRFYLFCFASSVTVSADKQVLIRHFFLLCLKGFALVLHSKCRSLSWPYMAFSPIFKASSALFQRPLSRCWQMLQQRPHSTELCSVQPE